NLTHSCSQGHNSYLCIELDLVCTIVLHICSSWLSVGGVPSMLNSSKCWRKTLTRSRHSCSRTILNCLKEVLQLSRRAVAWTLIFQLWWVSSTSVYVQTIALDVGLSVLFWARLSIPVLKPASKDVLKHHVPRPCVHKEVLLPSLAFRFLESW
ncbi:hypothetical protein GBAR_LOCUS25193, partial [Geodia barretti]